MLRGLVTAVVLFAGITPVTAAEPDYLRDVKPLLRAKCYACHGAIRQKGGLRLDAGQFVIKGSKRGGVVVPGEPDESALIEAITAHGKDHPRMPPEGEGEALNEKEVALFRDWVKAGAKAPTEPVPDDPKLHWAYQPPQRAKVSGPDNPIDAFLAVERAKHTLTTNPEADKPTLLRRVYLDLIGIPPTPDELAAFVKDTTPNAYEKVVDKLLASPMYGERWGRHWMDIWRYSDPFGSGEEFRYSQRHIWRWRDWIVESLNADKGYDRMLREMLAGDEIAPGDRDTLRATGYLARNWYKFNRNIWVQDTVEYTAAGFLGITLRCCRCHDHKYDPISQADHYRFRAFFEPHDVRIDAMPGQPDVNKDGVARVFDKPGDSPTYLFLRGDERTPDKSRTITPGVPSVFGNDLSVNAITFKPKDFAASLPAAVAEARRLAKVELETSEVVAKRATAAITSAKQRLDEIASGVKPKEPELKPFFRDTFAKKDDELWKVLTGQWVWENGKLVCKTASTFATVSAKKEHPASFMGRIKYKTTGGGIGSVGFSYDVSGGSFQAVYVNANKDSAVRPFHRVNGADSYPTEGVVPFPVKFNDDVTLDFAVRGQLLNVWMNGKLTSVYKLPVARKAGGFTIWTHDATAEFAEVTLVELPDSVPLADKKGEDRASPLGGPVVLTMADAERLVQTAVNAEARAFACVETARTGVAAVEARFAADSARFAEPVDEVKAKALAIAAGKAERRVAVLRAVELFSAARIAETWASETDNTTYTPLVKMDAVGSTGRRLALAKWITDAQNPLTARVAVNHIWMRHFGTPLVSSVANFGLNGKKPTHPELLDWLATELVQSKWSMKSLHRLMVTSQVYRLSSRNADGANKTADPENRYYWRTNARRMDAEVVRDSLLTVAGQLDTTMGGPIIDENLGLTSKRRSIYFRFNAEYKMSFLDQFDAASPTECYERRESVVPQQALALHNSALALNVSREVAKQLAKVTDSGAFVNAAFERVLGRVPTDEERKRCEHFLRDQATLYAKPEKLTPFPAGPAVTPPSTDPGQRAREDLVQVLVNHNDFVTVR
ncbi:MAG: PSD1 and planctomycete cytochrome C domain-containing protein [Planctomycetes bacterium]|nr:PSD1 and planctomycete cytochrome C domain-containing protein [Planctomycetota bacterium]